MRYLLLITAGLLVACNPSPDSGQGGFETIALDIIDSPNCVFTPVGEDEGVAFATYADNLDNMAVARYKGETIKLVPKEVPTFDGNTFDVTYEVIDYLKWQVRARSDDGTGELQLIRDGEVTNITLPIEGSCG